MKSTTTSLCRRFILTSRKMLRYCTLKNGNCMRKQANPCRKTQGPKTLHQLRLILNKPKMQNWLKFLQFKRCNCKNCNCSNKDRRKFLKRLIHRITILIFTRTTLWKMGKRRTTQNCKSNQFHKSSCLPLEIKL